ncbi:uncharacterized protein LOC123554491 [Mercenaria mercenaria]|uniref:uncharacterized protein LOC123554491 n=1 Tax=Mercenaria mercenaria TaxID=6596 RepID=UPI001E1E20DD|nr:uncharacterized protein LOC123554491 [Mercenaria mercenaria]
MADAGILFVIVVISCGVIEAGPLHGNTPHEHTHTHKVKEYQITANVKSGQADDPSWFISEKDRKKGVVNLIARALDRYTALYADGAKLAYSHGYKGYTIRHVTEGNRTVISYLPKCRIARLEQLLLDYTVPASTPVDEYDKQVITCTLKNCKKPRVPSECYAKATTSKP